MIKRYEDEELAWIMSDEFKVAKWQDVELACIEAKVILKQVSQIIFSAIRRKLSETAVSLKKMETLEKILHHDLNAFVEERRKKLPKSLRRYLHDGNTSYDIEEPAFALILREAVLYILTLADNLERELIHLAKKHRFTPMNERTHGQEAEMESLGGRYLSYIAQLRLGIKRLRDSLKNLEYSKFSGAIGRCGSTKLSWRLERETLKILGLKPFYGATQIIPRELYLATAQALCQIVQTINKIALDMRLASRSGKPTLREKFGRFQMGSSAMPHKKNPINWEKLKGMERLARNLCHVIEEGIETWEARSIEMSSAERVAWPDLCHTTAHAIKVLTEGLKGLQVYPDNMLWEIWNSRGCYASGLVKDWLKENGNSVGLSKDAYRISQHVAFQAHAPSFAAKYLRTNPPRSLREADRNLRQFEAVAVQPDEVLRGKMNIRDLISSGSLEIISDEGSADQATIDRWNSSLQRLFADKRKLREWKKLFAPSFLLRNEAFLFRKILGKQADVSHA